MYRSAVAATVTRLTEHVGAEISGMSGHDLVNRRAADDCLMALERHGVVIYREVGIDDDDLVDFSALLGDVVLTPTGEHERPEIQTITLDPSKTNPLLAAYRQGNFLWHFDGATGCSSPKGDTPQRSRGRRRGRRHRVRVDLRGIRRAARRREGGDRRTCAYYTASPPPSAEPIQTHHSDEQSGWDRVPTRIHPLVWTHRNHRKSMLLGATADEVVDWPHEAGQELLERLLAWSTQPQFVLRHHWRRGDLVIWDNTGMLHRALPFAPTSQRLLHRTTLVGDEPVA